MQILDTVVERGDPIAVRFVGEGGESIAVTLRTTAVWSDDEAIARAKVMLLHAARFQEGLAADAAPLPAAPGDPSYTLEYLENGQVRQLPAATFPSLAAVTEECARSAEDLWRDALSKSEAPTGWAVRARDQAGELVATVTYEDARDAVARAEGGSAPNVALEGALLSSAGRDRSEGSTDLP